MTINEILRTLNKSDKDALNVAFEQGIAFYVEWKPEHFIGVNTDALPHLDCTIKAGVAWRAGTIRKGTDHVNQAG